MILLAYLRRAGVSLDELLNVVFLDGAEGQSISDHAAIDSDAGRRWACVLCALLGVLVERGHCAKQLAGEATKPAAALRAGALLLFLVLLIFAGAYVVERAALSWIGHGR